MDLLGNKGSSGIPSTFMDPFKKDKVNKIIMHIEGPRWLNDQKTTYEATVYFRNGDTSGNHDIKGTDFVDLVNKVQEFIKTLT